MTVADLCKHYHNGNAWKWDELNRTEAAVGQALSLARFDIFVLDHFKLDILCNWIEDRRALLPLRAASGMA